MGQVKKIREIVLLVLVLCIGASGCQEGKDLPPELEYNVVRFKNDAYKEYVLTVPYHDYYSVFTCGASDTEFLGYSELRDQCYMSKQIDISRNCAISYVKWEDYSVTEHGIDFFENEIMDTHPLSAYYSIPELRLGVSFCYPASPEAIDSINAMIDDGRIEQYRVDLGY